MPSFRDTTQRRRVVHALLGLLGRSEATAAELETEALTGSERWVVSLASWIEEGSGGGDPGLAGWDLLDAPRQHAVATLLEALSEDALAYDQDPGQGGAAVDLWLTERGM